MSVGAASVCAMTVACDQSIDIAAPPELVWQLVSTSEGLSGWFVNATVAGGPQGAVTLRFAPGGKRRCRCWPGSRSDGSGSAWRTAAGFTTSPSRRWRWLPCPGARRGDPPRRARRHRGRLDRLPGAAASLGRELTDLYGPIRWSLSSRSRPPDRTVIGMREGRDAAAVVARPDDQVGPYLSASASAQFFDVVAGGAVDDPGGRHLAGQAGGVAEGGAGRVRGAGDSGQVVGLPRPARGQGQFFDVAPGGPVHDAGGRALIGEGGGVAEGGAGGCGGAGEGGQVDSAPAAARGLAGPAT